MKAKNILIYAGTLASAALLAVACSNTPKKVTSVPMYVPNTNQTDQAQHACVLLDGQKREIGVGLDYGFDNISDHVIVDIKQGGKTITREFVRRAESSTHDDWIQHPGASHLDATTYVEIARDKKGNARYINTHLRYMIGKDCNHRELQDGFQAAADAQIPLELIILRDDGTAYRPNMPQQ